MEKTLKVQFKFFKTVAYWSNENGQGVKVDGSFDNSHWISDIGHMDTIVFLNDISEIEETLKSILRDNYLPDDYLAVMDEGRLSFNTIENNDSYVLSSEEQERYDERGEQLYICDYDVMIEIFHAFTPSAEQLKTLFPMAEQMV